MSSKLSDELSLAPNLIFSNIVLFKKLTSGVAARKSPLVSNVKDPVGAALRAELGLQNLGRVLNYMNIVANKGDLFSIDIDEYFCCLGVVAERWKSEFYIVIFKEKFDSTTSLSEIELDQLTPVIASSSLDAKIWHGHWPIIRRGCDTSKILQPIYKVEESGGAVAESFDRKSRKQVTRDVLDKLRYRKGVAPVRLEKAIKAYHGVGERDVTFEKLRFSSVEESNLLVKSERF